ncbi:MBL fold metallo-hydrolase [Tissierella sp. Yu-01]|uniref:MBL fold metallo-hydrolase n=1 Tax=Tissierella sp. Yu-01 TaxID=3035694 RepID=UPI00240E43AA|nr:MBL fold metallo-hydrolase [Tissierella sp. Yu-01]WFA08385.1 MBL fold metallo-hydrolase [Tissierella sp. Yu-01]
MGNKLSEMLSTLTRTTEAITDDIELLKFTIVNAVMVDISRDKKWVLVDTGLENSADFIINAVKQRYGDDIAPEGIVLTHGHFDHVGSVITLAKHWNVPVFIHSLEVPYVTGKKDYPLADSTVDEGMIAKLSPTFPHTSIDISFYINELPKDGTIPCMPGWRWIFTPGHSVGHISLFRNTDRVLIVGDAFTTVKQESMISVVNQSTMVSGPPKYLTTDWKKAKESVVKLMSLKPSLAIFSHGNPLRGQDLTDHMEDLINNFDIIAKPEQGKFVEKE